MHGIPLALLLALPLVRGYPLLNILSQSQTPVASAWYPGWGSVPPSAINWTQYNSITYSFAVTTPDVTVLSLAGSNASVLPEFVKLAHENNVLARLSVGGWTGSHYFSTAVASAANRTAFVKTVTDLVTNYTLDGIDFDWEYPGKQGIGCNTISPNDTANYLLFLQELRNDPVGKNITLSAAVGIASFVDSTGSPMTDVSGFAEVLDFISIMNYDVWGSWSSTVGPNSPLNDTCTAPANQQGSAVSAVAAWTNAKFPANQIVLGVAAYGHSFYVTNATALSSDGMLNAYPAFDASLQPHGDSQDSAAGVDECGKPVPIGGIFNFWGLIDGGFLDDNGNVSTGIDYRYDNCSQTPYVYNASSDVMVSYDDATSFNAKGKFITDSGLLGFSMWDVSGDFNDILTDAIRNGMGMESTSTSSGCYLRAQT